MREFGVRTIRHLCPCVRGVGLPSAVFLSGTAGVHFAKTLRFSRFIVCPPSRFEFKAFLAQIRALAAVWRTCVLLTSVFIDWIGPWRSRVQKSALIYNFSRAYFGKYYKDPNCALRLAILSFSLQFCNAFKTYCKT